MSARHPGVHPGAITVSWKAAGPWRLHPGAAVAIRLREVKKAGDRAVPAGRPVMLASGIDPLEGKRRVQLPALIPGRSYRLELRKEGDPETGADGPLFTAPE